MTEPTTESRFDFPCPHCGKSTPVTMTVSVDAECTLDVGTAESDLRIVSLHDPDVNWFGDRGGFGLSEEMPAGYVPSPEQTARFDAVMGAGATAFMSGLQWSPEELERIKAAGPDGIVEVKAGRITELSVGIDPGARGGDFTAFAIGANGGAYTVGTIPAGVEIDPEGKWIDRITPPPSNEVKDLVRMSMPGTEVSTRVNPRENRGAAGSVLPSAGWDVPGNPWAALQKISTGLRSGEMTLADIATIVDGALR